jgi:hypothetical protein
VINGETDKPVGNQDIPMLAITFLLVDARTALGKALGRKTEDLSAQLILTGELMQNGFGPTFALG